MDKAAFRDFTIQIVKRSDTAKGFEIVPRRWVVERTFGWMTRWRRLVRDYEKRIDCSEAMFHVALASLLLAELLTNSRFQTDSKACSEKVRTDANRARQFLRYE
jgi:Transposase DDE domain